MPVTGVDKVKSNYRRVFKDIREKKAVQFTQAVLSIGWTASRELTPIEYGVLINSVTMFIDGKATSVTGELMYNANYAAALEFSVWRPRPINLKDGPATNMSAEPHFLRKGFESPESKAAIKQAINIFKV